MSMQVINEDHYVVGSVRYGAGRHTFDRNTVGTRYVLIAMRILVDPNDPNDVQQVHRLQDAIRIEQQSAGRRTAASGAIVTRPEKIHDRIPA
jgi:hypothetical protein